MQLQSKGAEHFLKHIQWWPTEFGGPALLRLVRDKPAIRVTGKTPQVIENRGAALEITTAELPVRRYPF
jgi:hypothetical protein